MERAFTGFHEIHGNRNFADDPAILRCMGFCEGQPVRSVAEARRETAEDLLNFGVIDGIIPEPPGGAQEDADAAAELMRKKLRDALEELGRLSQRELVEQRYKKFRRMGNFFGVPAGRSSL